MTQGPRVALIGLDCVTPQLLFRDLAAETPNIHKLMANGMFGDLASITPPITVPAWACGMTGKTPGQLGIYGFRNRKDNSYNGLSIATSESVREPAVWDLLGERNKKSVLIGVPPGYPIKPLEGWRISCFLTPPSAKTYAYPAEVMAEVEEELGPENPYIFDIPNFREKGMAEVHDQLYKMTERKFKVARRFVKTKPWDFFMMVEMGADRLHHVFWQDFDPSHPKYVPGNPYESAFQDYYRYLDREVGSLIELLPDDCVTIVMSDHGARMMQGGVCFNDWLIREGYLTTSDPVTEITPIGKTPIDWGRTVAWGDGGYYGRLFLNVKGREPEGIVEPSQYDAVRDELMGKLEAMTGPDGEHFGTKVLKPDEVYPDVVGVAPDLIVYFADLEWRSVGTVGNPAVFTHENDTGPDGANHDKTAVFSMMGLPGQPMGEVEGLRLVDVGPSILKMFGIDAPQGAIGRSFL
jgi:predicted AlkP superfamily phosphohydrolase/phosphomutase